mmetsp:Transcript_4036/g.11708  ORF Transcript_4036/g.11708 Transcript_4036/m.11708 type:complete len:83 (-) Transcript_4036:281-529(-)
MRVSSNVSVWAVLRTYHMTGTESLLSKSPSRLPAAFSEVAARQAAGEASAETTQLPSFADSKHREETIEENLRGVFSEAGNN